jgi:hypothetical protein
MAGLIGGRPLEILVGGISGAAIAAMAMTLLAGF